MRDLGSDTLAMNQQIVATLADHGKKMDAITVVASTADAVVAQLNKAVQNTQDELREAKLKQASDFAALRKIFEKTKQAVQPPARDRRSSAGWMPHHILTMTALAILASYTSQGSNPVRGLHDQTGNSLVCG
jgi:vacuolar-type H+-ATPase subunit I/STV1